MESENHIAEDGKKEKRAVVNIGNSQQKWHDLMLFLKNATPTAFCLEFKDDETARTAERRMIHQTGKYPSWFPMIIAKRGTCIYVLKTCFAKKVTVIDEPKKDD